MASTSFKPDGALMRMATGEAGQLATVVLGASASPHPDHGPASRMNRDMGNEDDAPVNSAFHLLPKGGFLRARNPLIGSFHHAPQTTSGSWIYHAGSCIPLSSFLKQRALRHHPMTGTFHSSPGIYSALHKLSLDMPTDPRVKGTQKRAAIESPDPVIAQGASDSAHQSRIQGKSKVSGRKHHNHATRPLSTGAGSAKLSLPNVQPYKIGCVTVWSQPGLHHTRAGSSSTNSGRVAHRKRDGHAARMALRAVAGSLLHAQAAIAKLEARGRGPIGGPPDMSTLAEAAERARLESLAHARVRARKRHQYAATPTPTPTPTPDSVTVSATARPSSVSSLSFPQQGNPSTSQGATGLRWSAVQHMHEQHPPSSSTSAPRSATSGSPVTQPRSPFTHGTSRSPLFQPPPLSPAAAAATPSSSSPLVRALQPQHAVSTESMSTIPEFALPAVGRAAGTAGAAVESSTSAGTGAGAGAIQFAAAAVTGRSKSTGSSGQDSSLLKPSLRNGGGTAAAVTGISRADSSIPQAGSAERAAGAVSNAVTDPFGPGLIRASSTSPYGRLSQRRRSQSIDGASPGSAGVHSAGDNGWVMRAGRVGGLGLMGDSARAGKHSPGDLFGSGLARRVAGGGSSTGMWHDFHSRGGGAARDESGASAAILHLLVASDKATSLLSPAGDASIAALAHGAAPRRPSSSRGGANDQISGVNGEDRAGGVGGRNRRGGSMTRHRGGKRSHRAGPGRHNGGSDDGAPMANDSANDDDDDDDGVARAMRTGAGRSLRVAQYDEIASEAREALYTQGGDSAVGMGLHLGGDVTLRDMSTLAVRRRAMAETAAATEDSDAMLSASGVDEDCVLAHEEDREEEQEDAQAAEASSIVERSQHGSDHQDVNERSSSQPYQNTRMDESRMLDSAGPIEHTVSVPAPVGTELHRAILEGGAATTALSLALASASAVPLHQAYSPEIGRRRSMGDAPGVAAGLEAQVDAAVAHVTGSGTIESDEMSGLGREQWTGIASDLATNSSAMRASGETDVVTVRAPSSAPASHPPCGSTGSESCLPPQGESAEDKQPSVQHQHGRRGSRLAATYYSPQRMPGDAGKSLSRASRQAHSHGSGTSEQWPGDAGGEDAVSSTGAAQHPYSGVSKPSPALSAASASLASSIAGSVAALEQALPAPATRETRVPLATRGHQPQLRVSGPPATGMDLEANGIHYDDFTGFGSLADRQGLNRRQEVSARHSRGIPRWDRRIDTPAPTGMTPILESRQADVQLGQTPPWGSAHSRSAPQSALASPLYGPRRQAPGAELQPYACVSIGRNFHRGKRIHEQLGRETPGPGLSAPPSSNATPSSSPSPYAATGAVAASEESTGSIAPPAGIGLQRATSLPSPQTTAAPSRFSPGVADKLPRQSSTASIDTSAGVAAAGSPSIASPKRAYNTSPGSRPPRNTSATSLEELIQQASSAEGVAATASPPSPTGGQPGLMTRVASRASMRLGGTSMHPAAEAIEAATQFAAAVQHEREHRQSLRAASSAGMHQSASSVNDSMLQTGAALTRTLTASASPAAVPTSPSVDRSMLLLLPPVNLDASPNVAASAVSPGAVPAISSTGFAMPGDDTPTLPVASIRLHGAVDGAVAGLLPTGSAATAAESVSASSTTATGPNSASARAPRDPQTAVPAPSGQQIPIASPGQTALQQSQNAAVPHPAPSPLSQPADVATALPAPASPTAPIVPASLWDDGEGVVAQPVPAENIASALLDYTAGLHGHTAGSAGRMVIAPSIAVLRAWETVHAVAKRGPLHRSAREVVRYRRAALSVSSLTQTRVTIGAAEHNITVHRTQEWETKQAKYLAELAALQTAAATAAAAMGATGVGDSGEATSWTPHTTSSSTSSPLPTEPATGTGSGIRKRHGSSKQRSGSLWWLESKMQSTKSFYAARADADQRRLRAGLRPLSEGTRGGSSKAAVSSLSSAAGAAGAAASALGAAGAVRAVGPAALLGAWKSASGAQWLNLVALVPTPDGPKPARRIEDFWHIGERLGGGGYATVKLGRRILSDSDGKPVAGTDSSSSSLAASLDAVADKTRSKGSSSSDMAVKDARTAVSGSGRQTDSSVAAVAVGGASGNAGGRSWSNSNEAAIKCIRKRFLTTDEERACVAREVLLHGSLRHPRIVRLIDHFEDESFAYLVLERVSGGTLQKHLQDERKHVAQLRRAQASALGVSAAAKATAKASVGSGSGGGGGGGGSLTPAGRFGLLSEATAKRLTEQLLEAVWYVHSRGMLHADIKPDNVLIQRAPRSGNRGSSRSRTSSSATTSGASGQRSWQFDSVKLCDFGHSRKASDARYYKDTGNVHLVPFESILGTQGYIAPEVLQEQPYSAAIDMWAVGVMLYEMISGYPPFRPPAKCMSAELEFPDRGWEGVSSSCRDLCKRMLTVDPRRRISSQDALIHAWFSSNPSSD